MWKKDRKNWASKNDFEFYEHEKIQENIGPKNNEDRKKREKINKKIVRKVEELQRKNTLKESKTQEQHLQGKKIICRGEHSLPFMFTAAVVTHFEMSVLNVVLPWNTYWKFVTNDTFQSPIGP